MLEQESDGLLWVWPSSDPQAWIESHANPPLVDPELMDPAWVSAGSEWDVLEQPVSWQSLVRPFSHEFPGTLLKGVMAMLCSPVAHGRRLCLWKLGRLLAPAGREAMELISCECCC